MTPGHVVPQILEALPWAIEDGLRLPVACNTSSYDSLDSLRLMDGIAGIYLPDLKVWTSGHACRYLRMPGYPQVAREAAREMNHQVGPLQFGDDGMARRGLLVRHLVMPGMLEETRAILEIMGDCIMVASLPPSVAALARSRPASWALEPPIWRRSHPRWQGVPPVPNSNSVAISVTDAEFFDGMRFARTGWPGTDGP